CRAIPPVRPALRPHGVRSRRLRCRRVGHAAVRLRPAGAQRARSVTAKRTHPERPPAAPGRWWLRPRTALPLLALIIAAAAVLTPQDTDARSGDARLSTYSRGPMGARMLRDIARRLGWENQRQLQPGVP